MPQHARSVTVLGSTGDNHNVTSEGIQYDSYYGYTDGLGTLQVMYDNFIGKFRIQGTLSVEPTDTDYFDIVPQNVVIVRGDGLLDDGTQTQYVVTQNSLTNELGFVVSQTTTGYVSVPAGQEWHADGYIQFTSDNSGSGGAMYVIRGNYTHVRVKVDRTDLPEDGTDYGQIQRVLLSS